MPNRPIRVMLTKLGLDGHDRGIKVIASALRQAGMEVIYAGLWQSPEHVARAAADEDVDVIGISLLSGAHLTLVPMLLDHLRKHEAAHIPVVVGGVIPPHDEETLIEQGVARVFGPGTSLHEIVQFIRGCTEESAAHG